VVTATKEVITDARVKNDANLFVMMFNPTCEHCEDMTRALETNIGLFKNSKILLMAGPVMLPYLEYFDKTTHYTQFPSIMVGVDSAKFIDRTFNYEMLPQINIYDKDRKLIRTFSGIETIDSLKPYIQ
jgi:thioredoxin-related protein